MGVYMCGICNVRKCVVVDFKGWICVCVGFVMFVFCNMWLCVCLRFVICGFVCVCGCVWVL